MKIVIFQPPYPTEGTPASAEDCLRWMLGQIDGLKPREQDLVLLPEYANAPGLSDRQTIRQFVAGRGADFVQAIAASAKRLDSMIVLAVLAQSGSRWFNRNLVFNTKGQVAFTYDKLHLTDAERSELDLTPGAEPMVFEHAGVRVGFATCFDLYFPEHFEALAAQHVDIVLCPSYQRSESSERIRLVAQARALDSGSYVIRSSYSMGKSKVGGHSLVATPAGALLVDAGEGICVLTAEIDPKRKFIKPASHGRHAVEHRTLIEAHRRPAAYRPRTERIQRIAGVPFPRLCAHRGLSHACPENTLPAFAAAIAVGADEIEFDLWMSRDRVAVVCHDATVDRTTDGKGKITGMTWDDIRRLDAGVKHGWYGANDSPRPDVKLNEAWRGTRIPRLEEVLELVDGRIGLNIHIKDAGPNGWLVKMVCDILCQQALLDIAYIAGCTEAVLKTTCDYAPEVPRACLLGQRGDVSRQIELAQKYACQRIQIWGSVNESQIKCAHDAGLICNYFWSDDAAEAKEYVKRGIDVILTNCAHAMIADGFDALRQFPANQGVQPTRYPRG